MSTDQTPAQPAFTMPGPGRHIPHTWEFDSTEEAYTASQTDDRIKSGDLLVVRSESVVGFLYAAWPLAVTEACGEFAQADGADADFLAPDGPYARPVTYARAYAARHGWALQYPAPVHTPSGDTVDVHDMPAMPNQGNGLTLVAPDGTAVVVGHAHNATTGTLTRVTEVWADTVPGTDAACLTPGELRGLLCAVFGATVEYGSGGRVLLTFATRRSEPGPRFAVRGLNADGVV